MSHFPEAPCFVMADWESYVCGEWSRSHTSEYVSNNIYMARVRLLFMFWPTLIMA